MLPHALLAAALAATPSASKLGLVAAPNDAATTAVLTGANGGFCPVLAVFPVPSDGSAGTQIAAYTAACAGAEVIAHVGDSGLAVNATAADTNFPTWLSTVPTGATAIEGPSNVTGTVPDVAAFWARFAQLARGAGLTPVVGAFAAGTTASALACPVLDAVAGATGVGEWWWSYHARSPGLTQVLATELATTFGYRAITSQCASASGIPIVLTEAGPASRGWQAGDASWLAFLDAQLRPEPAVRAAALVAPIAPVQAALEAELANPAAPDGGSPDAGRPDAGGGGVIGGGHPGVGGPLVPVNTKGGCSSAPGAALLALAPLLLLLRRRQGAKR